MMFPWHTISHDFPMCFSRKNSNFHIDFLWFARQQLSWTRDAFCAEVVFITPEVIDLWEALVACPPWIFVDFRMGLPLKMS